MRPTDHPETPEQLADAMAAAARAGRTIALGGAFTKDRFGGPAQAADVRISTAAMKRVLRYEPNDLTISVEAGLPYDDLRRLLAEKRQMVPLDPPFARTGTVGGTLAVNSSGPRRRLFGAARDQVIGLTFATLEGKLPQSGGQVVKNVAGLDMGKLLIGSYGTLAAIAVVNFKLHPIAPCSRTFLRKFDTAGEAFAARNETLRGVLQPVAIDLLNPAASARLGRQGWLLAIQAQGNRAIVERYSQAMPGAEALEEVSEEAFWESVREFTPRFLTAHPSGAMARLSCTLEDLAAAMAAIAAPAVARAGNGVAYVHFQDCAGAVACVRGRRGVVESASTACEQWPEPGDDFPIMKKIKEMFDPGALLNRGRLYGRI